MADFSMPVLDITPLRDEPSGEDARRFVAELGDAFHRVGFVQLIGHGVDADMGQQVHSEARRFFDLPEPERLQIENVHSPQFRGYTRMGSEITNGRSDRRDQIDVGREQDAPTLDPADPPWRRLQGPNLWPADLPGLRTATLDWMTQMEVLGRLVASGLARALGQPADYFEPLFGAEPEVRVKIIRYPVASAGEEQGVGAHRDNGLMTFLFPDRNAGLEIAGPDGFSPVIPVPGAFVVNIGEMLQLATSGYFRATVHRVRSGTDGERISIAYFMNPRLDASIEPVDLPAELAALAPGGANPDPANPVFSTYGNNAFKTRLRSHPNVAERHHRDLLGTALDTR